MTDRGGSRTREEGAGALALGQGLFYLATGAWPLVSMRSFEAVTGRKRDRWLVETVGGLLAVVGGALVLAGRRGRVSGEMALVAAGSAAVLATIDVVYVARRRISPVYLLDALAEAGLLAGWALTARPRPRRATSRGSRPPERPGHPRRARSARPG